MIETIINGEGLRVEVAISEDCHPKTIGDDICCLTCGTIAKHREDVIAITVGCAEGLKDWLSERFHRVQPEYSVLLCENCLDEFDGK